MSPPLDEGAWDKATGEWRKKNKDKIAKAQREQAEAKTKEQKKLDKAADKLLDDLLKEDK